MIDVGRSTRLDTERRFAIAAVIAASRLCRSVQREIEPSDATTKPDRSPVTVADLGAQTIVAMALHEELPDDRLMGEEDFGPLAASPELTEGVLARVREQRGKADLRAVEDALRRCDDPGGPARRWWTLDPVDGTKGFLRGEHYAVALALIEDGEVVLGVMGSPNLPRVSTASHVGGVGALFVAERGAGAFELPLFEAAPETVARPIHVASLRSAAEGRYAESVEAAHSNQSESVRIGELLGIAAEPLRLDSQSKYALVARGDVSVYLRLPHGDYRENVWDHAAGSIIVTEAGGRVSDVAGKALDFTTGTRLARNRGIVATAASIHDEVLEAVAAVLD